MDIFLEALDVAQTQTDINRIVTVSAWPLKVMHPLATDIASKYVITLVNQANNEPHTLRRANALFTLAAALQDSKLLLQLIMPSLERALLGGHGWRIDRLIRFTTDMVKNSMPEVLETLVAHHSEGRKKQLLIASLNQLKPT